MATSTVSLLRGMGHTLAKDHVKLTPAKVGWTNADLSTATGTDFITIMLELLLSTGSGLNYSGSGTNYDVLPYGIGLGIPQNRVNIAIFEAVKNQNDWDASLLWAYPFTDVSDNTWVDGRVAPPGVHHLDSKKIIQDEICRPTGIYVATDNNAKITLIRPKNPMKFHISKNNRTLTVKVASGGTAYTATMTVGIYNPTEMAAEAQRALRADAPATNTKWTVTYNTGTNLFTVAHSVDTWDLTGPSNGWKTLGFTSTHTNVGAGTNLAGDAAVGAAPTTTLTENDMWDVRQHDSRGLMLASVLFQYDWSWVDKEYKTIREYIDAETLNLGAPLGEYALVISSKGLQSSEVGSTYNQSPLAGWKEPASGCDPLRLVPPTGSGVDNDSATLLYAAMLLDRYKQPPMQFTAKLRWQHNLLELGDNVLVNYQVDGVFTDRELNSTVLTNRVFEVTKVTPNPRGGYVECEFLGHRSSTTASVVTTTRAST